MGESINPKDLVPADVLRELSVKSDGPALARLLGHIAALVVTGYLAYTLIKSITEKLLPLGDDVSFICGHGPGSTFGQERQTNPFIIGA